MNIFGFWTNFMMTVQNKYTDQLYGFFVVQRTLSNIEKNNYNGYVSHEVYKLHFFIYHNALK